MGNTLKKDSVAAFMRRARSIYVYVFLCCLLLLRTNVPVQANLPPAIDLVAFMLLAAAGGVILLLDLISARDFMKVRFWYLPAVLLVVTAISSLVNGYDLYHNFTTMVFCTIQFFLFTSFFCGLSREQRAARVRTIGAVLSVIMLVFAVASMALFVFNVMLTVKANNGTEVFFLGFYLARLFGVFRDPNYASVLSLVTIILSLYNFRHVKAKAAKMFYIVNIVFQYMYLVLSGSRTAEVCMVAAVLVGGYLLVRHFLSKKQLSGRAVVAVSLLIAVVAAGLSYASVLASRQGLKFIPLVVTEQVAELERPDIIDGYANPRLKIWDNALEIFENHPVIGVSPHGKIIVAKEEFPDGIIARRGYAIHNGYLDVLVSTGIVGGAVLVGYIIAALTLIGKRFLGKSRKPFEKTDTTMLAVAVVLAVSALFLSEIFFLNTAGTLLFWVFLGGLLTPCEDVSNPPAK